MNNPIKEICTWNKKAGNFDRPYNDRLESSMLIEEALEEFTCDGLDQLFERAENSDFLQSFVKEDGEIPGPREYSRALVNLADDIESTEDRPGIKARKINKVKQLDKQGDAAVIALGGMAKLLNGDPQLVTKALNIIMKYNNKKLKNIQRDEHGKVIKPKDFVGPEKELQELLDSIN